MRRTIQTLLAAAALAVAILAVGLGARDGNGGNAGPAPSEDVTGFWDGVSESGLSVGLALTQRGAKVTGEGTIEGRKDDVIGTVTGNTFHFTFGTATGVVVVSNRFMTGTCDAASGDHTFWTAFMPGR